VLGCWQGRLLSSSRRIRITRASMSPWSTAWRYRARARSGSPASSQCSASDLNRPVLPRLAASTARVSTPAQSPTSSRRRVKTNNAMSSCSAARRNRASASAVFPALSCSMAR
jgi:hypothetical protein